MTAICPRVLARREYTFSEIDLFMFSASAWLTHRIHFDREYARSEGFDDLVVHGPLQGAHLSDLLQGVARAHGGSVAALRYRHHRPILCGRPVTFIATLSDEPIADASLQVGVRVEITGSDGTRYASGDGALRFAAPAQAQALLTGA